MNRQRQAFQTRPERQSHQSSKFGLTDGDTFGNNPFYKPTNCFRIATNNACSLAKTGDINEVSNQKLRQLIDGYQLDGLLLQETNLHWKKVEPVLFTMVPTLVVTFK